MNAAGKVLVLGAKGQVGRALVQMLGPDGTGWDVDEIDVADIGSLDRALAAARPRAVINAAAYTAVDQAEKEEAIAMKVNGDAPGAMAEYCAEAGIPFVHYSTDYVFDGSGTAPWTEDDATGPLNAYGRSKLEGERQVRAAGGPFLILRTSWVYDESGKNFLRTMLRLGTAKETLSVVDDQTGAPTYAPHLARATLDILKAAEATNPFPSGVYHLCNAGETSWHGFAASIFEAARLREIPLAVKEVLPIATSAYPTPARRPLNSRMNLAKVERVFAMRMPDWKRGLADCMERYEIQPA